MTTTFHSHWRDVPEGTWRWPNFSPAEIACRGTGKLLINEPALDTLKALRDRLGKPLIVRSARVDAFLIGSEMRVLTTIRSGATPIRRCSRSAIWQPTCGPSSGRE